MMIHYVDREKRVTSTLLMESGKRVWTNLEGEQDNTSRPPRPDPT